MREILFKAKRVDNGEWVEGFVVKRVHNEGEFLDGKIKWGMIKVDYIFPEIEDCFYKIIPETLCEFTGLTDKNGKRIWEGDIVIYTEEIETRSRGKETLKGVYEVKFEYCGFSPLDCLACNHLEVIGNIHDNGELLTAERKE